MKQLTPMEYSKARREAMEELEKSGKKILTLGEKQFVMLELIDVLKDRKYTDDQIMKIFSGAYHELKQNRNRK